MASSDSARPTFGESWRAMTPGRKALFVLAIVAIFAVAFLVIPPLMHQAFQAGYNSTH